MLTKLRTLLRLVISRHRIGFRSFSEWIAFCMQLNPVLNLLFARWFGAIRDPRGWTASCARAIVGRGFGFGGVRAMTPEDRIRFSSVVLRVRPTAPDEAGERDRPALRELNDAGFTRFAGLLDAATVEAAKEHFARCPHFISQVYAQSDRRPITRDWRTYETNPGFRYVSFRRASSLEFLSQLPLLGEMKRLADAYCGFDTHLYGMNTFCTLPGAGKDYAMRIHRDYDDFGFLTFFIAWTKTDGDDGATVFCPHSHHLSSAVEPFVPLSAEAGDVFAADTFGLHAGNAAVVRPRLATWIRWGRQTNLATIQDGPE